MGDPGGQREDLSGSPCDNPTIKLHARLVIEMKDEHVRGVTVFRRQRIKACAAHRDEEPDFAGDKRVHVAKLLTRHLADQSADFLELLTLFCFHSSRLL